jgi:hypothetical protein
MGSDAEGRFFSEHTTTVMLSLHGAGLISTKTLTPEQELTLRSLETNREVEIRVAGAIGVQDGLHSYGVAFVQPAPDFWNMEFPPPIRYAEPDAEFILECSFCKTLFTLENSDFEADVCAIHGGLVRYCEQCGLSTVWRRTTEFPSAQRPAVLAAQKSESGPNLAFPQIEVLDPPLPDPSCQPLADARPPADRRERFRAKVNYVACVRSEALGQDVVHCIDMSRGGLSFRTKNQYTIAETVTIAVPFSPDSPQAPAIFVPARIANFAELPNSDLFRCGVAFLPLDSRSQ